MVYPCACLIFAVLFFVLFVVFICIGLSLHLPYYRRMIISFIRGFYWYWFIAAPALFSPYYSLFYLWFLSVLVYLCACLIFAVFFFVLFVVFICNVLSLRLPYFRRTYSFFYSWFLFVLVYRCACLIFALLFCVLFVVFICINLSLFLPYFRRIILCFIRGFYLFFSNLSFLYLNGNILRKLRIFIYESLIPSIFHATSINFKPYFHFCNFSFNKLHTLAKLNNYFLTISPNVHFNVIYLFLSFSLNYLFTLASFFICVVIKIICKTPYLLIYSHLDLTINVLSIEYFFLRFETFISYICLLFSLLLSMVLLFTNNNLFIIIFLICFVLSMLPSLTSSHKQNQTINNQIFNGRLHNIWNRYYAHTFYFLSYNAYKTITNVLYMPKKLNFRQICNYIEIIIWNFNENLNFISLNPSVFLTVQFNYQLIVSFNLSVIYVKFKFIFTFLYIYELF